MKYSVENWLASLLVIGIGLTCLVLLIVEEHDVDTNWVQTEGQVETYNVRWEDTGIDWNIYYSAIFYLPSEQRFVHTEVLAFTGNFCLTFKWWIFDFDCLRDNIPYLKIGEKVLIKYNPKNNNEIRWSRP